MKLGILLAGRRPDDIAKRLEQAREAGYSLCQLNLLQSGFTRSDLAVIADQMLEFGVRPIAVGCYVNPLRPDEASATGCTRADLDLLLHSLDIIGPRRIVLWSGTHADSPYDEHPDNADADSTGLLRSFVTDVVRTTRCRHYFLVIEPWHAHVLGSEQAIDRFHSGLDPDVAERIRYVLDAPSLLTAERYAECDAHAEAICRTIGERASIVHLRDCIMPPDGEAGMPGPGQGKLDYARYLQNILQYAPPDAPAIVRNVPAGEFAAARDYLLRASPRWELA